LACGLLSFLLLTAHEILFYFLESEICFQLSSLSLEAAGPRLSLIILTVTQIETLCRFLVTFQLFAQFKLWKSCSNIQIETILGISGDQLIILSRPLSTHSTRSIYISSRGKIAACRQLWSSFLSVRKLTCIITLHQILHEILQLWLQHTRDRARGQIHSWSEA
jgi:hypothetical protein